MKNTGVIRKIDELGRIVVPKEIRKNLNIKSGEDVQIYVEDDKIILKKYQRVLSIKEIAIKYLSKIQKLTMCDVLITDREKVILSLSKNYDGCLIDNKFITAINERKQEIGRTFNFNNQSLNKEYYINPIIVDADAIGSIILISNDSILDKDKMLIDVLNIMFSIELY